MPHRAILRAGVAVQSAALLGENVKLAKKKKKSATDFVKMGTTNIVGTELLRNQSQIIGTL